MMENLLENLLDGDALGLAAEIADDSMNETRVEDRMDVGDPGMHFAGEKRMGFGPAHQGERRAGAGPVFDVLFD